MLDRKAALPLYSQLESLIQAKILAGEWLPGDQIPTESVLCEKYQVSRITVRRAIADLEQGGFLERYPGRGTFIARPRFEQRIPYLTGFTQDMNARSKHPGSRILQFELVEAPQPARHELLSNDGQPVIILKRLRLADNEPVAVEKSYLSYDLCRPVLDVNFEDCSLYAALHDLCGIVPTRAMQSWEAIRCPKEEARVLGISKGDPVLHIYRTTYNQDSQPFEWVESHYRGDKYIFQAELYNLRKEEKTLLT